MDIWIDRCIDRHIDGQKDIDTLYYYYRQDGYID